VFLLAGIFFRLDQASLSVPNRRWWGFAFIVLCMATYVLAPDLFGKVTYMH